MSVDNRTFGECVADFSIAFDDQRMLWFEFFFFFAYCCCMSALQGMCEVMTLFVETRALQCDDTVIFFVCSLLYVLFIQCIVVNSTPHRGIRTNVCLLLVLLCVLLCVLLHSLLCVLLRSLLCSEICAYEDESRLCARLLLSCYLLLR